MDGPSASQPGQARPIHLFSGARERGQSKGLRASWFGARADQTNNQLAYLIGNWLLVGARTDQTNNQLAYPIGNWLLVGASAVPWDYAFYV